MHTSGRTVRMEFDWGAILGAFVTVVLAAGATTRWLVSRMDRMHGDDRRWDKEARDSLEVKFNAELKSIQGQFEAQIRQQGLEVDFLKTELHRYIKHVGVLEGILKSHDIDIPAIEPPVHRSYR